MDRRIAAIALLLAGCQSSRGLYIWGDYQNSVLQVTSTDGQPDLGALVEDAKLTIQRSADRDIRVPPGLHAHLGMLLASQGQLDGAAAAFLTEKEVYPESTVLIDGILSRMGVTP